MYNSAGRVTDLEPQSTRYERAIVVLAHEVDPERTVPELEPVGEPRVSWRKRRSIASWRLPCIIAIWADVTLCTTLRGPIARISDSRRVSTPECK